MFKFSTSTILNNFATGAYHEATAANNVLSIKHLGNFKKDNVVKVYSRKGSVGTPGSVKIAATLEANKVYRVKVYVQLSGSQNSNYANVNVIKGKPYAYEFIAGANGKEGLLALEAAINKMANRFGDKVFEVSNATASTITLTVAGNDKCYISVKEASLEVFDDNKNDYVPATATVTPVACVNPFGTYGQIIKDLRLPTIEATHFGAILSEELPSVNTIYNQYIIYMCVNRGIMGGDAVGEITKSLTAHAIWVPQTDALGADNFAALVAEVGTVLPYDETKLSNVQDSKVAFTDAPTTEANLNITE